MKQHGVECQQVHDEWLERANLRRTPIAPRDRPKSAPPAIEHRASEAQLHPDAETWSYGMKRSKSAPRTPAKGINVVRASHAKCFLLPKGVIRPSSASKLAISSNALAGDYPQTSGTLRASKTPFAATASTDLRAKQKRRAEREQRTMDRINNKKTEDKTGSNPLSHLALSPMSTTQSRMSTYGGRVNEIFSAKASHRGGDPGGERETPNRRRAIEATLSTKMKLGGTQEKAEKDKSLVGESVDFEIVSASSEGHGPQMAASNLAAKMEGQPFGWEALGNCSHWIIVDISCTATITGLKLLLNGGECNPSSCALQYAFRHDGHDEDSWTTACEFDIAYTDETISRKVDYEHLMQVSKFKAMLIKRFGSINRAWKKVLDTSGDGTLSYDELARACKEIGYKPPPGGTLQSLYLELDENGDGCLKLSDITTAKNKGAPRARYWKIVFGPPHGGNSKYAVNESLVGIKVHSPLKLFSTDILPVPRKEARAKALSNFISESMSQKVHAFDNDVLIDESEHEIRELAKKHGVPVVEVEKIKKEFDGFDTDRTGSICYEEFRDLMFKLMEARDPSDIPPKRIEFFWQMVDEDQSGSVEFEEFLKWQQSYFDMMDDSCGAPPMSMLAERFYSHAQDCRLNTAREWLELNPLRNRLGKFALSHVNQMSPNPNSRDDGSSSESATESAPASQNFSASERPSSLSNLPGMKMTITDSKTGALRMSTIFARTV